ncbi:MAG TPA: hypothetical protein P5528_11195 [Steroidobacteraceae bacterium]|nr:hypothetical protein [Steroidobacteraceae bacterium]
MCGKGILHIDAMDYPSRQRAELPQQPPDDPDQQDPPPNAPERPPVPKELPGKPPPGPGQPTRTPPPMRAASH